VRRSVQWSCGTPNPNARMQYNATAYTQPLRRIFAGIYKPVEVMNLEHKPHKLLAKKIAYQVQVQDVLVNKLYQPIAAFVMLQARRLDHRHQKDIRSYLAYTFYTILFLLAMLSVKQSIDLYLAPDSGGPMWSHSAPDTTTTEQSESGLKITGVK